MEKKKDLESKTGDETPADTAPVGETNEETPEGEADTSENTDEGDSGADNSAEDDNQGSDKGDQKIDYKTELADEKERREKAEAKIIKLKRGKKDQGDDTEQEIEPVTQDDINKTVDERLEKDRLDAVEDYVESQIELITQNVDEQKLILHHYENSVKKSGYSKRSIRKDLENAYVIANRRKILQQNRELRTSLKQKSSISNTGIGSNQVKPNVIEGGLSEQDIAFLKQRGKNPDDYIVDSDGNVTKKTKTKS